MGGGKGPQLELAVFAPMTSIEAQDEGTARQEIGEIRQRSGVIRQQEPGHGGAKWRRRRASLRLPDLRDKGLVSLRNGPAVLVDGCSEHGQALGERRFH